MLALSLRQPGTSAVPSQPLRSAHWIWLKGSGGMAPSSVAWTKVPAERAVSASARTHCDLAASADHSTTTAAGRLQPLLDDVGISAVRGQLVVAPHAKSLAAKRIATRSAIASSVRA